MKTSLLVFLFAATFASSLLGLDATELLREGLFEEEANRNPAKAAAAYAEVVSRYDGERKIAATAMFRLAEIRSKVGDKIAATALYQRLLAEFPDNDPLAKLSRERLGPAAPPDPAPPGNAPDGPESRELAHVRELVKYSPDLLDASNPKDGYTPLMQAAERGWMQVAGALLEHGAKANGPAGGGEPLHLAAAGGHKGMVELLLAHGAVLDAATPDGWTALHAACYFRRMEVLALLLARKANPNLAFEPQLEEHPGWGPVIARKQGFVLDRTMQLWNESLIGTPLFIALKDEDDALLTRLLDHGADPSVAAQPSRGATERISPLILALRQGRAAAVKTLLDRGAKIDFVMGGGVTALHAAALGSPAFVPLLLDRGLAQTADAANGWTPLFYAMLYSPATSSRRDAQGALLPQTAAEFEARSAERRLAWDALLAHGADLNARDKEGASLLHLGMNRDWSLEMLGWMLAHGADINARDPKGLTPLHVCCDNGTNRPDFSMRLTWLLDHGADVNALDASGNGPAAHIRDGETRLLIERNLFYPRLAAKLTRENAVTAFFSFKRNSSSFSRRLTPAAEYDAPPTALDLMRAVVARPDILDSLPLNSLTMRIFRAAPGGGAVEESKTPLEFGTQAAAGIKWPAVRWGDVVSIEADGNIGRPDWLAPAAAALSRTVGVRVGERTATLTMADPASREPAPPFPPVLSRERNEPSDQWSPALGPLPDWTLSELALHLAEAEPRADLQAVRLERMTDGKPQVWTVDLLAARPEDAERDGNGAPSRVKKSAARLADGDRLTIPLREGEVTARRGGIWFAAPGRIFATEVFAKRRYELGAHTLGELLMQAYLGPMVIPNPDLSRIVIHRLKADGLDEEAIPVDLLKVILDSGANAEVRLLDPRLEWGDTVEVSMVDGASPTLWKGFSNTTRSFLSQSLQRAVAITCNGQTRDAWALEPKFGNYVYAKADRTRNHPSFVLDYTQNVNPFSTRALLGSMSIEPESIRQLTIHWGNAEKAVFNAEQLKAVDPWIGFGTALEIEQFSP